MLSLTDFLISGLDIAFDHNTLDQSFQFLIDISAVKHFFDDTDLLGVLLVGVGMVGIHDHCRIFQLTLLIKLQKKLQILVMIVGDAVAVLVHCATQNGMCQGISG